MMMDMACVILAGGKSLRMGSDKALMLYQGKTFLEHVMTNVDFFEEKYIARGKKSLIKSHDWVSVADIYENCGPMAGIHAALRQCQSDALLVVSCDTPLIDLDFFAGLSAALQPDMDAVIPVTASGQLHPLCGIYRKTCLSVLEQQLAKGDYRMQSALSYLRVQYVQIEDEIQEQKLKNINTREEYQELINEID